MADKVGELEVDIKAKTEAAQNTIATFTKGIQSGLKSLGSGITDVGKGLSAVVTAPLLGIAAIAVESAMEVGKGYRIIQQRTGETGADLDKLKESFRNVYKNVPENSDIVATAIADVNKILDLTGKPLEQVVDGMLDLARVSGEEAKPTVEALSHAFKEWKIPAKDMGKELDFLYGVFTDTQVPVTELAGEVAKMGPMLQTSGIGFEQAASMIGLMKESGVDATPIMSGLRKIIKEAGDEGKPAAQKLKETFTAIKEAKTPTEAATIAIDAFGSRAGPILASKIRDGTLSVDGLTKSVEKLNLQKAAGDTITFGQAWTIVRHDLEVAMAPLGQTMLSLAKSVIPILTTVIGFIAKLGGAFDALPAPIKTIIVIIGGMLAALGPILIVVGGIVSGLAPIVGIIGSIAAALAPVLATLAGGGGILAAVGSIAVGGTTLTGIFAMLSPILLPIAAILAGIAIVVGTIIAVVATVVGAFALWYATSQQLRNLIGGALGYISNEFNILTKTISTVISQLTSGQWGAAFNTIKGYIQGVIDRFKTINWSEVWNQLVQSLRESINVIGTVVGGLRDKFMEWASKQDWKGIGQKIGEFIGKGIVAIFTGGVDILKTILDALSGKTTYAEDAGKDVGKSYGTGIQNYFKSGQLKVDIGKIFTWGKELFGGIADEMKIQLDRIHIDWGKLILQLTTGLILGAKLMGLAFYNAIAGFLHLPKIDTTDAQNDLQNWAKSVGDDFPISIDADPREAEKKIKLIGPLAKSIDAKIGVNADVKGAQQSITKVKTDTEKTNIKFGPLSIDTTGATNALKGVLKLINEIFESLPGVTTGKKFVEDTLAFVGKTAKDIAQTGVELWANAKTLAVNLGTWLVNKGVELYNTAKTTAGNAWQYAVSLTGGWWNNLKTTAWNTASTAWQYAVSLTGGWWDSLKTTAWNTASTAWQYAVSLTGGWWTSLKTTAWQTVSTAWEYAKGLTGGWWQSLSTTAWQTVSTAWEYAKSLTGGWWQSLSNTAWQVASSAWEYAKSFTGGWWESLKSIGVGIVGDVYNVVVDNLKGKLMTLLGVAKSGWEAFKAWLGLAEGGLVTQPGVYALAEKGPELVIPVDKLNGGQQLPGLVTPIAKGGGAGGVYIDVHGNTILDDRAASQLASKIRDVIVHTRGII